ncbi:MAG: hypothetical protein IJX99_08005 [Clostridia bacterium]|nr:hypothetical protein [Clostridia bacterium]
MKKFIIVFAYWWCIMYPSLGLDVPYLSINSNPPNQQNYEFKFKIVEYFKKGQGDGAFVHF